MFLVRSWGWMLFGELCLARADDRAADRARGPVMARQHHRAVRSARCWFRGTSDVNYRRVDYVIVALAALVSMPVFDKILH